jgi:hypothetical protein
MSGTFTVFPVIGGQLPSNLATLYTAVSVAYLKQVLLYNSSTSDVAITVYLVPGGGGNVPFRNITLGAGESYKLLEHGESVTLGAGDGFAAQADTANVIDYIITGVVET